MFDGKKKFGRENQLRLGSVKSHDLQGLMTTIPDGWPWDF